jgi:hypothetical protein
VATGGPDPRAQRGTDTPAPDVHQPELPVGVGGGLVSLVGGGVVGGGLVSLVGGGVVGGGVEETGGG